MNDVEFYYNAKINEYYMYVTVEQYGTRRQLKVRISKEDYEYMTRKPKQANNNKCHDLNKFDKLKEVINEKLQSALHDLWRTNIDISQTSCVLKASMPSASYEIIKSNLKGEIDAYVDVLALLEGMQIEED